jgi:hypothetical protein
VELTRLGTRPEREQTVAELRRELGAATGPGEDGPAALPGAWQEVVSPEGLPVLIGDPVARRWQTRIAAAVAVAAATVTTLLARSAVADFTLLPLALMGLAASAGLMWAAVRLARGRVEWRLGSGRIVEQRRFGGRVEERFVATRLELTASSDSDGDEWFRLEALAAEAESHGAAGNPWNRRAAGQRRLRRTIAQAIHDDSVPRRLGRWLARRADLPLVDRTTAESRAAELATLRVQLAESGRLGRMAARWIDRARRDRGS